MGLDVYLYRYEDFKASRKAEEEYEERTSALWEKEDDEYDNISDELRKEEARIAQELGMEKADFGYEYPGKKSIELDSEIYPDHLFKIGYLRSSYNEAGINSVLSKTTGTSMDEIFGVEERYYAFQPDWEECRNRARKALKDFKAYLKKNGDYSVMSFRANNLFGGPEVHNKRRAMEVFQEQVEKHKDFSGPGNYSCRNGEFYLQDPRKVFAFIPGEEAFIRSKVPCVYAICENPHGYKSYLQSLEIMIEMCDWVLAQPDKDKYYLHWSR